MLLRAIQENLDRLRKYSPNLRLNIRGSHGVSVGKNRIIQKFLGRNQSLAFRLEWYRSSYSGNNIITKHKSERTKLTGWASTFISYTSIETHMRASVRRAWFRYCNKKNIRFIFESNYQNQIKLVYWYTFLAFPEKFFISGDRMKDLNTSTGWKIFCFLYLMI